MAQVFRQPTEQLREDHAVLLEIGLASHNQAAARAIAPPDPAPRLPRRSGGFGENRAQIGEERVLEERIRLAPLE
jgi:hypothetical protein